MAVCKHPDGALSSPIFPTGDPNVVSLLCGKCGERVPRDLRDGAVTFDTDEDVDPDE